MRNYHGAPKSGQGATHCGCRGKMFQVHVHKSYMSKRKILFNYTCLLLKTKICPPLKPMFCTLCICVWWHEVEVGGLDLSQCKSGWLITRLEVIMLHVSTCIVYKTTRDIIAAIITLKSILMSKIFAFRRPFSFPFLAPSKLISALAALWRKPWGVDWLIV